MANVTFAGFEATINIGGAAVAVAENCEVTLDQTLERVMAIGDFKPQDLKEVAQNVGFSLRRAYFADASAADFFTKSLRDANGYLNAFTMTLRLRDLSTGIAVDKTFTLSGCKVAKYGGTVPAGKGLIMEKLDGEALNMTRA